MRCRMCSGDTAAGIENPAAIQWDCGPDTLAYQSQKLPLGTSFQIPKLLKKDLVCTRACLQVVEIEISNRKTSLPSSACTGEKVDRLSEALIPSASV